MKITSIISAYGTVLCGSVLKQRMISVYPEIDMNKSRNKKKGIEVTHWKISDADDFQGVDTREDTDIEPALPDECDIEDKPEAE
jgi:hypothetical protein